jgi:hypothetical protein
MRHVTTDLKFGSCTALSSSSPAIEASKVVTVKVESTISVIGGAWIDVACTLCTHYIDDLLPYASLELSSYWGCGQVFRMYKMNVL